MSVRAWLDERLGLTNAWRRFAHRAVPGGARLRHVFPAVLAYLLVQQGVLGIVLATYYSPSATDAWASTAYLQDRVSMGWFVRGLHYHGASAFVVVSVLYVLSLAAFRGWRSPRELVWLGALGLVGVGLAFGLTGNPLPWDLQGYWALQVELGIIEQSPGGGSLRTLLQGGSEAGNLSILRLYALHVFVLPLVALLLIGLVIAQIHRHGPAVPSNMSDAEARRRAVSYFPGQMFLDVSAMAFVAAVLIGLTVSTDGAELYAPADPTENFQARPEWYFLFLYQLRSFFEGPLEPIATMVIPGAAAAFLVAAPFVDRMGGRTGRIVARVGVGTLMTGVVGLTGLSISRDRADESYRESLGAAHKQAVRARELAREGVVPVGGPAVYWNDPAHRTRQLYKEHCQNCHAVEGIGGNEAPDLTDYSSRAWLAALIRNANDPRFFGNTKHNDMDPYPEEDLPEDQLHAVVEYLVSISGDVPADLDETLAATGKALWDDELECNSCHEVEAGKEGEGPNLFGHGSRAWVQRVIRDSSRPDLFGKAAQMPKFEGKLTDEEIEMLAAFVVGQRVGGASEGEPEAEPNAAQDE